MKQIIRLTESDLHRLVEESVCRILAETDASSSGDINRPVFPIVRKPSPVGKPIYRKDDELGNDASDRTGGKNHSLSVNYVGELDEGKFSNALRAGALGAMMMFGSNNANAQAQNYQPQQNDTVQTTQSFGNQLRNKGWSENDIQQTARNYNPGVIMLKNSKGMENSEIKKFLSSLNNVSSSMSTDSIKVFNYSESKQRMNFLSKFNESSAKKYKLFIDGNENAFIMPINYTLQDVQKELGTFQLGDFDI